MFGPFIQIIREKHPLTPILVVSPIYSSEELIWGIRKSNNYDRRELTRKIVSGLIAQGDRNIQLMEGTDLLSPSQGDGLTDGAHPNDLGFEWIANGLSTRLATMLGLNPKQRATCAQESLNK